MWGCRANMCLGAQSMHFSFFHLGCQFFRGYFANMGVLWDWKRWLGHWNRALKVKPIHGNGHGPSYTQTKCSRNKLSKILPRKQLFPLLDFWKRMLGSSEKIFLFSAYSLFRHGWNRKTLSIIYSYDAWKVSSQWPLWVPDKEEDESEEED